MWGPLGLTVEAFHGGVGGLDLDDVDVCVCTPERCNLLVSRMLETRSLSQIATIVVDEAHMIGTKSSGSWARGATLELALSKVLFACSRGAASHLQIVAMSATLPNVDRLATWLDARLYVTDWRPVPLKHLVVSGSRMYQALDISGDTGASSACRFEVVGGAVERSERDVSGIVTVVAEMVVTGRSVIVFAPSASYCENCAGLLASSLPAAYRTSQAEERGAAVSHLRHTPTGLCGVLAKTVPNGVAYHHAGLTHEERCVVEAAYRAGTIRVVVATTTLGAGVNLPCARVVFREPRVGPVPLTPSKYAQMAGRAGRHGLDAEGDSVLLGVDSRTSTSAKAAGSTLRKAADLMFGKCDAVESQLATSPAPVALALLDLLASRTATCVADLLAFLARTFGAALSEDATEFASSVVHGAVEALQKDGLIGPSAAGGGDLCVSHVGLAVFRGGGNAAVARRLHALRTGGVCLLGELHLLSIVVPPTHDVKLDWEVLKALAHSWSDEDVAGARAMGARTDDLKSWARPDLSVSAPPLNCRSNCISQFRCVILTRTLSVPDLVCVRCRHLCQATDKQTYCLLYSSLLLRDVVAEQPLTVLEKRYQLPRGEIQNFTRPLQPSARFCETSALRWDGNIWR